MKKYNLIYFFQVLTLLLNSSNIIAQSNPLSGDKFFSGFKILQVPRDNISIGSQWISKIGPKDSGMITTNLFSSKSISDYEFETNKEFNVDLKVTILKYLGVNLGYERFKTTDLKITQAEIVRVNDLSKLNYSSGREFIFEGIKVNSFSLITTKEKTDTIVAKLDSLGKGINIGITQGSDNKKNVTIKGLNLFIAYRLIRFGDINLQETGFIKNPKIRHKKNGETVETRHYSKKEEKEMKYQIIPKFRDAVVEIDPTTLKTKRSHTSQLSGFKIGSEYEGDIYTNSDFEKLFSYDDREKMLKGNQPTSCSLVLILKCYNELVNGSPKLIRVNLNCNNNGSEEYNVTLDSKIENGSFTIDELHLKILNYEQGYADAFPIYYFDGDIAIRPYFTYRRVSIPITDISDNSVRGW